MKYRMNDVSKMIGIRPQTIRFYEQYGILPADRGGEKGERRYGVMDVNILMRTRMYRNAGFTLAEASQLQNSASLDDMRKLYAGRAAELEREIRDSQRILRQLRRDAELLERIAGGIPEPEPCQSPGIYGYLYSIGGQKNSISKKEYGRIHQWVNLMPVVQPLAYFKREELPSSGRSLGFFIQEEDCELLRNLPEEGVFHIPPAKALHVVLTGYAREHDLAHYLNDYLKKQCLAPSADIFGRVITSLDCNSSYQHYTELWVPV